MSGNPEAERAGNSLEEIYRRIHREKMLGLPILNPALEVEAVGFLPYCGHSLGMLITPWFMKLMLLPGEASCPGGAPPAWRKRAVAPNCWCRRSILARLIGSMF